MTTLMRIGDATVEGCPECGNSTFVMADICPGKDGQPYGRVRFGCGYEGEVKPDGRVIVHTPCLKSPELPLTMREQSRSEFD